MQTSYFWLARKKDPNPQAATQTPDLQVGPQIEDTTTQTEPWTPDSRRWTLLLERISRT